MLPELLIKDEGDVVLRSLILEDGFTTFGRVPESNIVLDGPSISRNHGAFYHRERFGILTIEDHGSLNGTFVNGLQIKRKILFSGDVVLVGDYEIHVRHGSSEPQRTEAPFARIRTE